MFYSVIKIGNTNQSVDITKIHINNFINFTKKNTREHGGWAPDDRVEANQEAVLGGEPRG